MSKALRKTLSVLIILFFSIYTCVPVHALPAGQSVVAGSATFVQPDAATLNITTSDKVIINYDSFDIAQPEHVQFFQPNSSSVALNRVTNSMNPTSILGSLSANGRIFVINPNGIMFGADSQINTNSFMASTLDIANDDFLSGRYEFNLGPGGETSAIINRGRIQVADDGFVGLIAPRITNDGQIVATNGKIVLASAEKVVLDFDGDGLINYALDGKVQDALITNTGTISADGGDILLGVNAAKDVVESVVNNGGLIEAGSIVSDGGVIRLVSLGDGQIENSGELNVSAIEDGADGGDITVAADYIQNSGQMHADATVGNGGTIDVRADEDIEMTGDTRLSADALNQGSGGDIYVVAQNLAAVDEGATLDVKGGDESGDGGFVEVSGRILNFYGRSNRRAANGKSGLLFLDPDFFDIDAAYVAGTLQAAVNGGDTEVAADQILTVSGNMDFRGDAANLLTLKGGTTGQGVVDFTATSIQLEGGLVVNGHAFVSTTAGNGSALTISSAAGNITFNKTLNSGNYYLYDNSDKNYADHTTDAVASSYDGQSGYLVTVTSAQENWLAASIAGTERAWLGATDSAVEDEWRWVQGPDTGAQFWQGEAGGSAAPTGDEYENWNGGEPNDNGAGEDNAELYGYDAGGNSYEWNDIVGTNTKKGVYEYDLAETSLTLTANSGTITFTGDVGDNEAFAGLTIDAQQVDFDGKVSVAGALDIDTSGGSGTVSFDDDVTTTSNGTVTISNAGTMTVAADGDMTLDGTFLQDGAGTTTTSGDITTSNDNITFTTGVTLAGASAMNAGTGDIWFKSTIGNSGAGGLTLDAQDLDFDNTVSIDGNLDIDASATVDFDNTVATTAGDTVTITNAGTMTLLGAADFTIGGAFLQDGAGGVTTSADITTSNDNVQFDGAVTLTGSLAIDAGTGDITFSNTVGNSGAGNLTLDSDDLDFDNTVAVQGNIDIDAASTVEIDNTVTTTAGGSFTVTNGGALTLLGASDMTLDGLFLQDGAGAISTAGDITTTNDNIQFDGAVTLTGNVTLDTDTGAGNVDFNSTIEGNAAGTEDLTITSGTGTVIFDSTIGDTTRLDDISVTAGTEVQHDGTIEADTVTLTADLVDSNAAITTSAAGTSVTLTGDEIDMSSINANAGAGTVAMLQRTGGEAVQFYLGSAAGSGTGNVVELMAATLDNITAGTVKIGDANTGNITIQNDISITNATNWHLTTGGTVTQEAGDTLTVAGLAITADDGFTLTEANDVDNFAANTTNNSIDFTDSDGFTVDTVDGVTGITLGAGAGDIDLITQGVNSLLTISQAIAGRGNINLTADNIEVGAGVSENGADSIITVKQYTAGTQIDLGAGANGANATIEMDDGELDNFTTGTLRIGDSNSGAAAITAAIDAGNVSTIHLRTGAGVTQTNTITESNLAVTAESTVTLTQSNDVDNLSIVTSNDSASFTDSDGIDIDTVDGVVGVNVGTGDFTLIAGDAVTDEQAIIAQDLVVKTLNNGGAAITLDVNTTDVDTVDLRARNAADGANAAGAIEFHDADAFQVKDIATTSTVDLLAVSQGITQDGDGGADVTGTALTADSVTGISLDTNVTNVDLSVSGAGAIDIDETNAITLTDVDTGNGAITIVAGGTITATDVVSTTNADANDISLTATAGNIALGAVDAKTAGDITLSAAAGTITDASVDVGVDVTADELTMTASTGIGTAVANEDIDMTVANVEAVSATGVIYLSNSSALTIGGTNVGTTGVSFSGAGTDISIDAGANLLTVDEAIAGVDAVTLSADKMDINAGISEAGSNNIVTLQTSTGGGAVAIDLGSGTDAAGGTLELSDAELDQVSAGTLRVGDSNSGGITVSSAITNALGVLHLRSSDTIAQGGGDTITATNLALTAGGTITLAEANDVDNLAISTSADNAQFTDSDAIDIDTVDSVVGVNVGAADFTLIAGGAVTDAQAITANDLVVTTKNNAASAITLDVATTDADTIDLRTLNTAGGAVVGGTIQYVDADGFSVKDVQTTNTVALTATTGAISEDDGAAVDILGSVLTIDAVTGIDVDTTVTSVNASTSGVGNIEIDDSDGITLTDVDTVDGSITISAGGDIAVTDVAADGDGDPDDVSITSTAGGNITIDVATADGSGDVIIISAGDIDADVDDGVADITADAVSLTAAVGGIGTAEVVEVTATGAVSADTKAGDDANILIESIGDLTVGDIDAGAGDVTLTSSGDIDGATDDGTADVLGGTINLTATSGGIGNASDLDVTATTALNADTDADDANIIIDSIGALPIGSINAGTTGDITLESTLTITDGALDAGADIVGDDLVMTAITGIGTAAANGDIDVTISNLEATTTAGGIYVQDTAGGLEIGGISGMNGVSISGAGGDIVIETIGDDEDLTITEAIAGPENITLKADDMLVNATVSDNDGSNNVILLQPSSTGYAANLGDANDTAGNTLEISEAEMDNINGGTFRLGATDGGDLNLSGNITPDLAKFTNLHLVTGGDVLDNGYRLNTDMNVAATAGAGVDLSSVGNNILNLAVSADGYVQIGSSDPVTITTIDGVTGINSRSGNIFIGTSSGSNDDVTINENVTSTNGTIAIQADDAMIINANIGAATPNTVNLLARDETITHTSADTIDATTLTINAQTGIGTVGNKLKTNITTLALSVEGTGDAYVTETDGVNIATVVMQDGSFDVTASGAVTASSVVSTTDDDSNDVSITGVGISVNNINAGTTGDVTLNAGTGAITQTGGTDVTADELTTIAEDGVDLDTSVGVFASNNTGAGNITIDEVSGIDLGTITTANGNVTINAGGNVTDSGAITTTNLVIKTMLDGGASIIINDGGSDVDTLDLRARNTADGADDAGAISFEDTDGFTVEVINTTSTVNLTTTTGSIVDDDAGVVDITGTTLTIDSQTGMNLDTTVTSMNLSTSGIGDIVMDETDGVTLTDLDTDDGAIAINAAGDVIATDVRAAGSGDADDVSIVTTAGDITFDLVSAVGSGDVTITASAGSINEAGAGEAANDITADVLTLTARDEIGGAGEADIETTVTSMDVSSTTAGDIVLTEANGVELTDIDTVNGAITVVSTTGDITLDTVDAGGGNTVTLEATAGSINEKGTGDAGSDISGTVLTLTAQDEIGGAAELDIETTVTSMDVSSTASGNIVLTETDTITLTDIDTANGAITIEAGGTMDAQDVSTATTDNNLNDISLSTTAGDIELDTINAGTAGDLSFNANGSILDADGNSVITGDDMTIISGGAMGAAANKLNTTIDQITAGSGSSGTGDIYINETNALLITALSNSDGLTNVTNAGDLTAVSVTTTGDADTDDILLTTTGGGALEVGTISASGLGDVVLTINSSISDADSNSSIVADDFSFSTPTTFGTVGEKINTSVNEILSGTSNGVGGIFINETNAITLTSLVNTNGLINFTAGGDTTAVSVLTNAGTDTDDITMLVTGSIEVGTITASTLADLSMTATAAITDADGNSVITADDWNFTAGTNVGSAANNINTTIGELLSGNSTGTGDIYLNETDQLTVTLLANADGSTNITAGNQLDINLIQATGGTDTDDVSVTTTAGNIIIDSISVDTLGDVTVNSAGTIADDTDAGVDIVGDYVTLDAAGAITLDTNIASLNASTSAAGAIDIDETNAIDLADVDTNNGTVTVDAGGAITASDVNTSNTDDDSNDIALTTTVGGIEMGAVNAGSSNDVTLTATTNITDTDTNSMVTADDLTFIAATNVGANGASINTTITELVSGQSTGTGDIYLNETNAVTVTSLTNPDGSINLTTGGTVTATSITTTGGTDTDDINVTASVGDIDITAISAASDGDVVLTATTGSITDQTGGEAVIVTADGLGLYGGTGVGGTGASDIDFTANNLEGGFATGGFYATKSGANLTVGGVTGALSGIVGTTSGDIILPLASGDLTISEPISGPDTVSITVSTGKIITTADDGTADVSGSTVNLIANTGGIGSSSASLDVAATTSFSADTDAGDDADIYLDGIGDLPLGLVDAGSGNVTIDSTGDIDSVSNDGTADIEGANVTLVAAVGGIGDDSQVEINASTMINADTESGDDGNIDIERIGGDMVVGLINAGWGDVTLTSPGSMNAYYSTDAADIEGGNVTLVALVGGVGQTDLDIIAHIGVGIDTSNDGSDIILESNQEDLRIAYMNAGTGDIYLYSDFGITDSNGALNNATGGNLLMRSVSGIGSTGTIETQVSTITEVTNTTSGHIRLSNTGELDIRNIGIRNRGEDIELTVSEGLTLTSKVDASGNVAITAGNNILDNIDDPYEDIVSGGNMEVTSTTGYIGTLTNPIEVTAEGRLTTYGGGVNKALSAMFTGRVAEGRAYLSGVTPGLVLFNNVRSGGAKITYHDQGVVSKDVDIDADVVIAEGIMEYESIALPEMLMADVFIPELKDTAIEFVDDEYEMDLLLMDNLRFNFVDKPVEDTRPSVEINVADPSLSEIVREYLDVLKENYDFGFMDTEEKEKYLRGLDDIDSNIRELFQHKLMPNVAPLPALQPLPILLNQIDSLDDFLETEELSLNK